MGVVVMYPLFGLYMGVLLLSLNCDPLYIVLNVFIPSLNFCYFVVIFRYVMILVYLQFIFSIETTTILQTVGLVISFYRGLNKLKLNIIFKSLETSLQRYRQFYIVLGSYSEYLEYFLAILHPFGILLGSLGTASLLHGIQFDNLLMCVLVIMVIVFVVTTALIIFNASIGFLKTSVCILKLCRYVCFAHVSTYKVKYLLREVRCAKPIVLRAAYISVVDQRYKMSYFGMMLVKTMDILLVSSSR